MRDVRVAQLAARQFNRVSRAQLEQLGLSDRAIDHRVANGRLVIVDQGVYAVAPVLDDDWGRWKGATLAAPGSVLSHASAAAAWGFWSRRRPFETITRQGSGGPQRHGGVLVFRSSVLKDDCEELRRIPITSVPRTLLDLAAGRVSDPALARAVREAVRLDRTTLGAVADCLARHRGRRGAGRLGGAIARYAGLPLERARSGAEVRAMEILRDAGRPLPDLNVNIAGEEADLSWKRERLIIEIDGRPFHLDRGEDARKEACWRVAGWAVRRISSDEVYRRPQRLLALAPAPNVAGWPL